MKRLGVNLFFAVAAILAMVPVTRAESTVDPALPVYQRVEKLTGHITLTGSDTMSHMAAVWGDSFRQMYPDVVIEVQVKGSTNAVSSVAEGAANFGMLSNQIQPEDVQQFESQRGYVPTLLTPALESIAIYVHKDNPIKSLTLKQLDAIFSQSLKRGASKTATTWGDLGVTGEWARRPIAPQIRHDETGSQVFFQTAIMGQGEFRRDVTPHESNLDLVQAIESNPNAIGFAGSVHELPGLKAVPLAWKEGDQPIELHTAGYPFVRPLQIVVDNDPGKPLPQVQQEFIKFIFSRRGQQDVSASGFLPIPARPAQVQLSELGFGTLN